ncbi:hypothetical protein D3C76_1519780 [compost metagenome]
MGRQLADQVLKALELGATQGIADQVFERRVQRRYRDVSLGCGGSAVGGSCHQAGSLGE